MDTILAVIIGIFVGVVVSFVAHYLAMYRDERNQKKDLLSVLYLIRVELVGVYVDSQRPGGMALFEDKGYDALIMKGYTNMLPLKLLADLTRIYRKLSLYRDKDDKIGLGLTSTATIKPEWLADDIMKTLPVLDDFIKRLDNETKAYPFIILSKVKDYFGL